MLRSIFERNFANCNFQRNFFGKIFRKMIFGKIFSAKYFAKRVSRNEKKKFREMKKDVSLMSVWEAPVCLR